MSEPILVSACLLGLPTRYDGACKRNTAVLNWLSREGLIPVPVCPEQLGGLSTPREQTSFASGDGSDVLSGHGEVRSLSGQSMNGAFLRGARITLQIAQASGCRRALLKERSPSCGVHQVYRGELLIEGSGVTAALLAASGITIFSETDLADFT